MNLSKAIPGIVAEAMKACGWTILDQTDQAITARTSTSTVTWAAGQGLTVLGYGNQQGQIGAVTRAYSKAAVTWAAQRAGWQVQQTSENQLQVTRR